jgi:hypothetical protein
VAEEVRGRKGQESKEVSYIKLAQHLGINVSSEDADKLVKPAQQAYAAGEAAGIAAERTAAMSRLKGARWLEESMGGASMSDEDRKMHFYAARVIGSLMDPPKQGESNDHQTNI